MRIIDTPEKYLSNIDLKSETKNVRRDSVKVSSTRLSDLIHEIYNRVNRDRK